MNMVTIGFGGGCHWCTESVFKALRGVTQVSQGYIQSLPPHHSFSEAVVVNYDDREIALDLLIEIHLRTHASTSNHKMRGKYRSAIYTFSQTQAWEADNILAKLQVEFEKKLVTQILPHRAFKASDERFVNYGEKNADGPFCKAYIDPKLSLLREEYRKWVKSP
jgi:peptide-methionine (S)-S-oxide reductase